jgi:hypothetical protein
MSIAELTCKEKWPNSPHHYCSKCNPRLARFSFLCGYPGRSDSEEEEVHRLQKDLIELNEDPGWIIYPRSPDA